MALFSSIKSLFGKSEASKTAAMIEEWKNKKKGMNDQTATLKSDIRELEGVLRAKKAELDSTRGESREIIEQELKSTMDELDQKKRKQEIIFGALGRLNVLVARVEEMRDAQGANVSIDKIQELEVVYAEVVSDLKDADRAVNRVGNLGYSRPVAEPKNYAERIAALAEPVKQTPAAVTQAGPETKPAATVLSDAERERLNRLTENTN
jgi:hypothetical protein